MECGNTGKGLEAFLTECEAYNRSRCLERLNITFEEWIEQEARAKGRLFNSLRNVPDPVEEATKTDQEDADAVRYNRETRGS